MKPLYKQMAKEKKLFDKMHNEMNNRASQDAQAEARTFQVHQMQESIVHIRSIW